LPGITTRVSGTIPFGERTSHYISRDLVRLVLLAGIIILAFYYLGFRAKRAVLLPFVVVILTSLQTSARKCFRTSSARPL
jgi:predicted RND superfamily exporter protein